MKEGSNDLPDHPDQLKCHPSSKALSRRQIFERIYADKEWGDGGNAEFYSGGGSDDHMLLPYSEVVRKLFAEKQIHSVLDIGCGDFRAGRAACVEGIRYIGIDIVPALIERNQREFCNEDISFLCLDVVSSELPSADLCIVKQVLQHLSNRDIAVILQKTKKYRYVLITEHWPAPSVCVLPNKDKPTDGEIRIAMNSGVYPHLPPFDYPEPLILLESDHTWPDSSSGQKIVTMLFEH